MARAPEKDELLQGTLDLLILRTLTVGKLHGYAIARHIAATSNQKLIVEEGSLYPALHRMEHRGWIEHEWGRSESNRRAKFYRLTPAGRKQLTLQRARWDRFVCAVAAILQPTLSEGT
jgi:transcriptional regulator